MTEHPPNLSQSIRNSQLVRVLLVGLLVLVLQIPIGIIDDLIGGRLSTRDQAVADVTAGWGGSQAVIGPVLRVPYRHRWTEREANGERRERTSLRRASFLPDTLTVIGTARSEVRYRGIFEVPVYRARLELRGGFERPDWSEWGVAAEDVLWERAELVVALADPRAIQSRAQLEWDGREIPFLPVTEPLFDWGGAIQAPLAGVLEGPRFAFRIPLELNGTGQLAFAPLGATTEVELTGDWPHPSFQGSWLPSRREIRSNGFRAAWTISNLGRNYPQRWRGAAVEPERITQSQFGVSFLAPVDPYRMSQRSLKYQLLFLTLTFLTIWLFEVLAGLRVHPLQYLLVGAAMCLFYVLQLSLAEHLGFLAAYLVASGAVSIMVTLYSRAFLAARRAGVIGSILVVLYGYLYVLLRQQDYALLVGSLGLFAALGLVMWVTRRVDWYGLEARIQQRALDRA